jgi:hypothetical protein
MGLGYYSPPLCLGTSQPAGGVGIRGANVKFGPYVRVVSGRVIKRVSVTFQPNLLVFVLQHPRWLSRSVSHHCVCVWQPLQYLRTEMSISVCDIAECFTSGSHRVGCWTDAISVIVRVDSPPQSVRCVIGSRVYSAHQCFSC